MTAPPYPSVFAWPCAEYQRELHRRRRSRHGSILLRRLLQVQPRWLHRHPSEVRGMGVPYRKPVRPYQGGGR